MAVGENVCAKIGRATWISSGYSGHGLASEIQETSQEADEKICAVSFGAKASLGSCVRVKEKRRNGRCQKKKKKKKKKTEGNEHTNFLSFFFTRGELNCSLATAVWPGPRLG